VTRSLAGDVRCSACEQRNSPSARFCRHCGARRGAAADSVPPAPETAQASAPGIISSSDFPLSGRPAARRPAAHRPTARRLARRPAALAASALAVVATLALVGWLAHWPAALFAAKQPPAAQVGAVAGARSPRVITSSLPSSPTVAASTPGQATPAPATSAPATSASAANQASRAAAAGAAGSRGSSPAATVKAYFRAINSGNYAKAWRLGGRNTGVSYTRFAAGFAGTARDALKVLSVAGDAVTARLAARQADGTTKSFEGTYTVDRGVITQFAVQQVS
jgi:hypothetical protein